MRQRIAITLEEDVLKKLDQICETNGSTRSAAVSFAICQYVQQDQVIKMLPAMLEQLRLDQVNQERTPSD